MHVNMSKPEDVYRDLKIPKKSDYNRDITVITETGSRESTANRQNTTNSSGKPNPRRIASNIYSLMDTDENQTPMLP